MLIAVKSLIPESMQTEGRCAAYWVRKFEEDSKDEKWRSEIKKQDPFSLGMKLGNKILDFYLGANVA